MLNNRRSMSDEILECILPYIQDPRDRASISSVCRQWFELDRLTRRHVTIALCYTTTPQRLHDRFPNIESLKLKGKPRAAMFNLIPEDWGGYVRPWIDILASFPRLKSLHFRRMIVTDADLEMIASIKGQMLQSLKLDKCSNFSTDGLLHITRSCWNLRTLFLEDSTVAELNSEWLHQLALHNKVLETLNFYVTFMEKIKVEDLELLARNCPLVSAKIGETDLSHLGNFFRTATRLQEFSGGSFNEDLSHYSNIVFPAQMTSLGPMFLVETHVPVLYPVSKLLRKLDLVYASLNCEGHCDLIRRCQSLEVLETTNAIGDEGLEVVSLTCKRLKRLRIERGIEEQGNADSGVVTQTGLIAVAQGCPDLEYLAVYVTDITNEALECVGTNLKFLKDFRLVLLDREEIITDLPLDNGVRALLRGCHNMQRFALYLRQGGLTDIGLSYIGQFGRNVRWMLLGFAGETDAGLLEFSRGCPSLEKLEMRACCFTERALATAATQLTSLRYMWVQGYRASQIGIVDILAMARPYWNIELIPGDQYDQNSENDGEPARVDHPSHIVAYYSLAGQRTDHPETVYPLALPDL
ncbi:coronatine-insensitive protein 1 [Beta vulgaris subsp. vulgaris]|uniref:coronatine-insensitive protein 1 n=1 Tax=Beta vulgaris subsp. vulgaris TaxID=3555 RepID=UPI000540007D|nr:coronatine-insensitive protein 1 [Beta vulgaris subsp. vulgaris]